MFFSFARYLEKKYHVFLSLWLKRHLHLGVLVFMIKWTKKVPIGFKIFGIAISMLVLLITLSYITSDRATKVSHELTAVSDYLIPLEEFITKIDIHTLQQELVLEQVWRIIKSRSLNLEKLKKEQEKFKEHGRQVEKNIALATQLFDQAIEKTETKHSLIDFVDIRSKLKSIEQDHSRLHKQALEVMASISETKDTSEFKFLQKQLDKEEDLIDSYMISLLILIENFTQRSSRLVEEHEREVLHFSRILVMVAIAIGLLFSLALTKNLVRPLKDLLSKTRSLEQGNLDAKVDIRSQDEIGDLADIFNSMVHEIRKKERIKATFGQFVDPRIVDSLLLQSKNITDKGEKQTVTVFFSDVAGFSAISEMLTPEGLVNLINQYLTLASEPIIRYHGVIDKFIGDAVVAFWGPPFVTAEEHANFACSAALEQFIQLEKLRRRLPDIMGFRKGLPNLAIRVGLATGEVVMGNVGSKKTKSYTIIGKTSQVAEEMESSSKKYGTQILISQETQRLTQDTMETRKIDFLRVKEKEEPIEIFELLCHKGELSSTEKEMRDIFEAGLEEYLKQSWQKAQEHFQTCLRLKTDDKPAKLYLERLQHLQNSPPGDNWDGTWT